MILYSNEIVFRGHPDKVCDQISDAILTKYLTFDPNSHCGIEVAGGKGKIFITGEISSQINIDIIPIVEKTLTEVGYNPADYEIINNIGFQSSDIALGVDTGGAGDQGMMFGYACNETDKYIPKAMAILQEFSQMYDKLRKEKPHIFYPDGKAQITGYYEIINDYLTLQKIKTFTISYQNCESCRDYSDMIVRETALMLCNKYNVKVEDFLINPTGRFEIGGFAGDAGLTGRKIVVDNYQSFANVGGGAFSGKDPSKVDRSAAYKARQIAIDYMRKYDIPWCSVQLSYAIGVKEPLAIYINSPIGNIQPSAELYQECIPENIRKEFNLNDINYVNTAKFGHFGLNFPWEVKK